MVSIDVPLPDDLHARAKEQARVQGLTLEEFVRQCVTARVTQRASDSLFADLEVWNGPTPADLSDRHDDYLYGDDQ
ncbi:MAG: hypothetical protein KDA44_17105 [Planctomycetales bacterium]|nr:hypothetical protein [Planctomycetales bacterium]